MTRARNSMLTRLAVVVCTSTIVGVCHGGTGQSLETHDLMILDARIVDGTGAEPYIADVLIDGGIIQRIGDIDTETVEVSHRIDATGKVLAPGFIDTHAHGDPVKDSYGSFLAMGVTTIVLGQDGRTTGVVWSGESHKPRHAFAKWLAEADDAGVQVNVVPMAGHGTIRWQSGVGASAGVVSDQELEAMRSLLREDMEAGAFGMTTGLEYVPGIHATAAELVALAKVVGEYDGIVMSHMRSEDDDKIEASIAELAAQGAHARVHISHLKIVYGKGRERAEELLGYIRDLKNDGLDISADIYPYNAGYAWVGLLFPVWALPPNDYDEVVVTRREELARYLHARMTKRNGPDALLLASPPPYKGLTLEEAARERGQSFVEFLLDAGPDGAAGAHFTQDEATHDALVASSLTAISTDGAPNMAHPRSTGTYAKLIEKYVRGGVLSLQAAVQKATGLPAAIMMLEDRGVIREGAKADLVIFDPARVEARSDYLDPFATARGFDIVLVNGAIAYSDGELQPGRYGEVLRRR